MKALCLVMLALVPAMAQAAGYGGAEGRNRAGEIIHIGADSYYELLVQKNKDDHEWVEHYDMSIECPAFEKAMQAPEGKQVFSCPAKGRFPLSGATYRITISKQYQPCNLDPFFDETPGTVYICIAGCGGKRAPKLFHESPWEC